MLRSFYLSLLEIIESRTLSAQPVAEQPLPEFIRGRFDLHAALVQAIADRDQARALELADAHNATTAVGVPYGPGAEDLTSPG